MANIAIINYCNLQCPYCFANRYITEEEKQVITMEQLEYILEFLSRSDPGRVGLIGGEPTLHPQFSEILKRVDKFCEEYSSHSTIFTNGIYMYEYARALKDRMTCLINVNHPTVLGDSRWSDLLRSLDRMKLVSAMDRSKLGINLYSGIPDYDYIFELALRYNKDCIRTSYVAPTCEFSQVCKDEYYNEAKEIFIPYVEKAKSLGITVNLDCNHIPLCYFTESELAILEGAVEGYRSCCEPVVDITPDFKGTACFGAYELVGLRDFENLPEVERYLKQYKMKPLAEKNCTGKCEDCKEHESLSCQGGCLAFSNH